MVSERADRTAQGLTALIQAWLLDQPLRGQLAQATEDERKAFSGDRPADSPETLRG